MYFHHVGSRQGAGGQGQPGRGLGVSNHLEAGNHAGESQLLPESSMEGSWDPLPNCPTSGLDFLRHTPETGSSLSAGPLPTIVTLACGRRLGLTFTFAGQAVDQAQEAQEADPVPWIGEVGPGGVDVAGSATLGLAYVGLQHQAADGLSALLEPADATCGPGSGGDSSDAIGVALLYHC